MQRHDIPPFQFRVQCLAELVFVRAFYFFAFHAEDRTWNSFSTQLPDPKRLTQHMIANSVHPQVSTNLRTAGRHRDRANAMQKYLALGQPLKELDKGRQQQSTGGAMLGLQH